MDGCDSFELSSDYMKKVSNIPSFTGDILIYYENTLVEDGSVLNDNGVVDSSSSSSLLTPIDVISGGIGGISRNEGVGESVDEGISFEDLGYEVPLAKKIVYSSSGLSIYSTPPINERVYGRREIGITDVIESSSDDSNFSSFYSNGNDSITDVATAISPTRTSTQGRIPIPSLAPWFKYPPSPSPIYYKPIKLTDFKSNVKPINAIIDKEQTINNKSPYKLYIVYLRCCFLIGFIFPIAWIISSLTTLFYISPRRKVHKLEEDIFSLKQCDDRFHIKFRTINWTSPTFIDCWIIISKIFGIIGIMYCILIAMIIYKYCK